MSLYALLLVAVLAGCSNPYEEARKADTIEAYEKFLAEHADHSKVGAARARLGELKLDLVRKQGTLEAYDAFLKEFPKGKAHDQAMKERKPLLLAWAEQQDTAEAWQKVLDDYNKGDRKTLLTAQRRMEAARERDKVAIGPVTQERVNMADDPKAEPDGWLFKADVTNRSDKPARELYVAAEFSKDDATLLTTRQWPVVARRLPEALPLPPGFDAPMRPGETRTWAFKVGNLPEGWTKVDLRLAKVDWVDDGAAPETATPAPN